MKKGLVEITSWPLPDVCLDRQFFLFCPFGIRRHVDAYAPIPEQAMAVKRHIARMHRIWLSSSKCAKPGCVGLVALEC